MASVLAYLRKSLTRRFVAMMVALLVLILLGAIVILSINYHTQQLYLANLKAHQQKQELIAQIETRTEGFFYAVRGYYVSVEQKDYDDIMVEKAKLDESLAAFRQLSLNGEEQRLASSVDTVIKEFMTITLPKAVAYAKAGDYASLRDLSSADENKAIADLLRYAEQFRKDSRQSLNQKSVTLLQDLSNQGLLLIGYILFILLIAIWVTRKTAREIGGPLATLSERAERFARGEFVEWEELRREDEIGQLSQSFAYMMTQIQAKEEELMAQNEELIAQQDELQAQQEELQAQQEELQSALRKMEGNERYLQRRNRLVQALANTLNKQELLESIVKHTVLVTGADKGIIVLFDSDRSYASFGVATEDASRFSREMDKGIAVRVLETKQPYVLKRECQSHEQAYQAEPGFSYDLFVPVLDAAEQVIACIALTRIGKAISSQEEQEAIGLSRQIGLSLEKLGMYEQTETQRQMTRDMLNTLHEGVQLMDVDGIVLHVNSKICELLECTDPAEITHIPVQQFVDRLQNRLADPGKLAAFFSAVARGAEMDTQSVVYEIIEPSRQMIQLYFEPLYRGTERFGTVIVHRDITKEYEVDRMKSEFVSTVSHELRTPLASVLGFTELLLHRELKPERQRKYLTTIHQEANRLTGLINDFLDLQRMESGKQTYHLKQIDIVPIIAEVIEQHQVNTAIHAFSLDIPMQSVMIEGDTDKVRQVFTNLIGNAVKYSPQGGTVTVRCRVEGTSLMVDIEDTGLGIPEEELPKLFSKFYRIDNTDRREIGGTGLGLAIVKEIMAAHHGSISVASKVGIGSTFTVQFPIQQLHGVPAQEAVRSSGQASGTGATVMIIEDDFSLAELLTEELTEKGFRVLHHSDGQEAIRVIKQERPDALVVDLILNNSIDGWTIIQQMKTDEQLARIPIIISSAFEEKERGFELGAKGYLIKPYHPHKLSEVIMETLLAHDRNGQIMVPKE